VSTLVTAIKRDCVASDILGACGRAMLNALCQGTTDPESRPSWRRAGYERKSRRSRKALEGRFEAHHTLPISASLAHLNFLDEQIERLSEAIEEQLHPLFSPPLTCCARRGGIETRTAQNILAEIATDISVFPTASHCAS